MAAQPEVAISRIASAIGVPPRARMLYCLMDGRARTATELAAVAEVGPPTASVHLERLRAAHLVTMVAQGKGRYYTLAGARVAKALEGLSVLAGFSPRDFVPTTPAHLRAARTCYDHIAGRLGVLLHDRLKARGWITASGADAYELTASGMNGLATIGIDVATLRSLRRRLAFPCLDWSERRPHVGGALGAALLQTALRSRWVVQDADSRSLQLTARGRRELAQRFDVRVALT